MLKMKLSIRMGALALAAVCGVNAALAQNTYTVDGTYLESFNLSIDGKADNNALAGGMQFNYVSGTGPGTFRSICTDISGQLWLSGTYTYAAPTVFAGNTGLDPTWGVGNQNSPPNPINTAAASAAIQAAADIFYKYQGVLSEGSGILGGTIQDNQAALQLAVWAALYNTSAGQNTTIQLNGPRFDVASTSSTTYTGAWAGPTGQTYAGTSAAVSEAQTMLNAVNFQDAYSGNLMLPLPPAQNGGFGPGNTVTAQSVLVNVTPVPEPTTLVAGGLLLLPFAASTLRMRSRRV